MPSSVFHYEAKPLHRVLVIDDLPMISLAFQEVLRSVNPAVTVEYCANVFTALSAKTYAGVTFDLVILGSPQDRGPLERSVTELKDRFARPLVMLYSGLYDPVIIEKMAAAGIDAYVHRYETIDEIREAYRQLTAGMPFVSGIFRTLYHDYGYDVRK